MEQINGVTDTPATTPGGDSGLAAGIRPHVFADLDGAEWRCVGGKLQVRDFGPDGALDRVWGCGPSLLCGNDGWLRLLDECFPQSVAAARAAIASPMTTEEAEADDDETGASTPSPEETDRG